MTGPTLKDVRERDALEYSIKLQRLIENLKYPNMTPPYPELHHHKMIVEAKELIRSLQKEVNQAAGCTVYEQRPGIWASWGRFDAFLKRLEAGE